VRSVTCTGRRPPPGAEKTTLSPPSTGTTRSAPHTAYPPAPRRAPQPVVEPPVVNVDG
jgi:hypothetical protein